MKANKHIFRPQKKLIEFVTGRPALKCILKWVIQAKEEQSQMGSEAL